MKKCFKCNKYKKITLFYKHKQMADGHLGKCKKCFSEACRDNRRKNIAYYKAYDLARNKTKARRLLRSIRKKKHIRESPGKWKAWHKVTNAIRDGRLFKEPCVKCGSKKVEAHHHDYRKPLDIKWLCLIHHREEHGRPVYVA